VAPAVAVHAELCRPFSAAMDGPHHRPLERAILLSDGPVFVGERVLGAEALAGPVDSAVRGSEGAISAASLSRSAVDAASRTGIGDFDRTASYPGGLEMVWLPTHQRCSRSGRWALLRQRRWSLMQRRQPGQRERFALGRDRSSSFEVRRHSRPHQG
jgi:hypothetical protein